MFLIKSHQLENSLPSISFQLKVEAPTPLSVRDRGLRRKVGKSKVVNWTSKGFVSSVKDQGSCGACYAFAALADIESTYLMRGKALDLSEQQIVDCTMAFYNWGC